LAEEGIEVMPLPIPAALKEPLQDLVQESWPGRTAADRRHCAWISILPADDAFRADVRAWLEANLPHALRAKVLDHKRLNRDDFASWHILGERGWSAPAWPVEYGGPGWNATQRHIWEEDAPASARRSCCRSACRWSRRCS
jgi:alkylation response protein AidB-like acyl-CoA dehydrogenase